jgi:hypothetical protein
MASRALIARFRSALSSWAASTRVRPQASRADHLDLDVGTHGAADQLLHAEDEPVHVVGLGSSVCRRAKARSAA